MTEAIKQWIADQAKSIAERPGFARGSFRVDQHREFGAISGLTKGIEIAEGFELWKIKIGAVQRITGTYVYPNCNKPYTFYELLEKYLKTLEP